MGQEKRKQLPSDDHVALRGRRSFAATEDHAEVEPAEHEVPAEYEEPLHSFDQAELNNPSIKSSNLDDYDISTCDSYDEDDPESVLHHALHHFGQSQLPDGNCLDVDAMLDKMLEDNCKSVEAELQRQINEQLDNELQKQLDEQIEEYFKQKEEEELADLDDGNFGRKRSHDFGVVEDQLEKDLENHLLSQMMEQILQIQQGPPTIAQINADIQKSVDRYRQTEAAGDLGES